MCVISQTICPECGCEPEGYAFSPCRDFIDQIFAEPDDTYHGHRLCCPNFVWPIQGPIPVKVQPCEDCIFRPLSTNPVRRVDVRYAGATAASLAEVLLKNLTAYDSVLAFNERTSDLPHRYLTLRIPYCDLCQKPYFCLSDNKNSFSWLGDLFRRGQGETADSSLPQPTIEGIEFEFSSYLWKWMRLVMLWQAQGHEGIETNIQTGFIHRPCNTCINRETVLRGKLTLFVERCDATEAWAIWTWLMMRGSGQVNFWWHELRNSGLPNLPPPKASDCRALMAAGWKARTGVAWEDIYDVELGEHPLLFTPHRELFTSLSQWNAFARIRDQPDPVAMLPPPLLDTNNVELEYDPAPVQVPPQQMMPGKHHRKHRKQRNGRATNGAKPIRREPTPQRHPQQPTLALHKPDTQTEHHTGHGSEGEKGHLAKRLRFAEEVSVLASDGNLFIQLPQDSSSPADSDRTLVENDEGNDSGDSIDDLFNDTAAVLSPCEFGFYHVKNMDQDHSWQLPLGVGLREGKPIELARGGEPSVPGVRDQDKGRKVAQTEGKGKKPEILETKGKNQGKELKFVVIQDNEQDKKRRGSGENAHDPQVLSSDDADSDIYN
ncbi:hypothetical protein F4821DRAFT_274871 [Hypoxylon rubiginosum]|uniref:Uncharacterized protein n=1 Tax=Hypoxylon rubiginosum TaxID=110542 RepID=A0ACC0CMH1_9PEZI|nr:hypothetical protein F4821DRAFT_274871 [Hypoxylon rubiginosum]